MNLPRGPIAVVVALVVGILMGLLVGVLTQGEPDTRRNEAVSHPSGEEDTADEHLRRSGEGAALAARKYVLISASDVIRDRESFVAAMERAAAPSWAEEARKQAIDGHTFLTDRYGTDVDITAAVMRYKVLNHSPEAATVKLWVVSVASGSEQERVDEAWGTAVVQLSWIAGGWRVSDVSNSNGPAPVDLPGGEAADTAGLLMRELNEVPIATP